MQATDRRAISDGSPRETSRPFQVRTPIVGNWFRIGVAAVSGLLLGCGGRLAGVVTPSEGGDERVDDGGEWRSDDAAGGGIEDSKGDATISSVSGSALGRTLAVEDVEALWSTTSAGRRVLTVVLSNRAGVCDRFESGNQVRGEVALWLELFVDSHGAVSAGTYPVVPIDDIDPMSGTRTDVGAALVVTDDNCDVVGYEYGAASGSVTIGVGSTEVGGMFELHFPDGQMAGTFVGTYCGATDDAGVSGPSCP